MNASFAAAAPSRARRRLVRLRQPHVERQFSPGPNIDFWVLGLQILGIASLAAAVNFFVTIINLRAPGMTLMRHADVHAG